MLAEGTRFPMLRQQTDYGDSRPNRSLADYIAPADSGLDDHLGAFAVAIHGADELAQQHEARARRLLRHHRQGTGRPAGRSIRGMAAPAGAPKLVRARREPGCRRPRSGALSRASGPRSATRPAPTTPRSSTLFRLLDAGRAGLELTESCAMSPAAAVSGLYSRPPRGALLRGRPHRPRPARATTPTGSR